MDFNAAIFDLDGTILDSMDVWEHIDIQFLKKRNLPVPENYVTEICARSFEEAAQYTIDLFGLQETVEGIIEEWNNMAVEEYSNHVGLLPHALDYLLRLKEHGIKLAVATGLPEKLYIPCLKNNSILELFDALCSTDEVQRGKEYSDVFELAARKLGVAPEHCIVFDDVLPAIKSAKAARMLAGGIYDKYSADQRKEIELILCDLELPDGTAMELFHTLRRVAGMFQMKNPPVRLLPFFILTENNDPATEYEYRHEGVNDYITAPVNIPELIRQVLFFVE